MGVAVLQPQDCLKHPLSHMKFPRNPSACPNKNKKPISNRIRRSPPRNQSTRSPPPFPPPKETVKKSPVKILKRGEELPKEIVDLVVENADLGSTRRTGPDPVTIPIQIRLPSRKSKSAPLYAGPVTMSSPPPSEVPLPVFFTTKRYDQAADATNNLIKLLRLEI